MKPHEARYRQRWLTGRSGVQVDGGRIVIPEDVERRDVHSPCFNCESRGPCRHRPWMLRA